MGIIQKYAVWVLLVTAGQAVAQKTLKPDELRIVLFNVQFAAEKAAINRDAAQELDEVAALLKKSPAVTLEIGAHTDASGSASYNLRLSQQRATAVSAYLTKKGISTKRFTAKGFGETQPLNRCRRGIRCSEAEKRENRRVELRVKRLPAEVTVKNQWLALGGQAPVKSTVPMTARKVDIPAPTYVSLADDARPSAVTTRAQPAADTETTGDYFPELNDGKQHVPQPLPNTFAGYTIEFICADKPLPAGHALLRKYDAVFLRQEAGGRYCYFIGGFNTLPDAQQFLQKEALPKFPKAQVVSFSNNEKKYFTQ